MTGQQKRAVRAQIELRRQFEWRDGAVGIAGPVHWDRLALPLDGIEPVGTPLALSRFAARFKAVVWDAAMLTGSPLTFAEVSTLVDGAPLLDRTDEQMQQVVALIKGYRELVDLVEREGFEQTWDIADGLNRILDITSPTPGRLREGPARVGFGDGETFSAPAPRDLGAMIRRRIEPPRSPIERAIGPLAYAIYVRPYAGANDSTSQMMMNGALLSTGFDAISASGRHADAYTEALVPLFGAADATPLLRLLLDTYIAEASR